MPRSRRVITFAGHAYGPGIVRLFNDSKGDAGKMVVALEQALEDGLARAGYDLVTVDWDASEIRALEVALGGSPGVGEGAQSV